jgi:hypothetical protein
MINLSRRALFFGAGKCFDRIIFYIHFAYMILFLSVAILLSSKISTGVE